MPPPPAIKSFLSTPFFAVLGAVPDPARYGHKVLTWYHTHSLPVTGVHPRAPPIPPHTIVRSIAELPAPAETALSFVTPPAATLAVLRAAADLAVPAVWFQPGAADDGCVAFARAAGMVVVGGGWCVLVHGEEGLRGLGRL